MVTPDSGEPAPERRTALSARLVRFARAVQEGDEATVEELILKLSRSRRLLAPLALAVGGFVMLFNGLKLLFSNWRLTLVQALPAMWIWLAMIDLKAHVLRGKSFNVLRGPILIPIVLSIVAITAASFFLNAVFGFAIVQPGVPEVRPAVRQARSHVAVILGSGALVGLLLGLATMVVTRWGHPWFGISLSVVIGVMMVCYVAVPSRLIGAKPSSSRRDKLTASAMGGLLGRRLHAALRTRAGWHPDAWVECAVRSRHRDRGDRSHAPGGCHRRRQDGQDECQATRLRSTLIRNGGGARLSVSTCAGMLAGESFELPLEAAAANCPHFERQADPRGGALGRRVRGAGRTLREPYHARVVAEVLIAQVWVAVEPELVDDRVLECPRKEVGEEVGPRLLGERLAHLLAREDVVTVLAFEALDAGAVERLVDRAVAAAVAVDDRDRVVATTKFTEQLLDRGGDPLRSVV